jgi:hypothetical protein
MATIACYKEYTLHVDPVACPAAAGSIITGDLGIETCCGDKDTTLGRLFVSTTAGGGNVHLYDTSGGFIADLGHRANHGATWISSTHKFCYIRNTLAGYTLCNAGGATGTVGTALDLRSTPDYASDDDACYGFGYDGLNSYLSCLDATTEAIILNVGIGNHGFPEYAVYCPSPKILAMGTFASSLKKFTIPGGVLSGTIDLSVAPYQAFLEGLIYHPASATIWATARRGGNLWLVEIDPTTWTLRREIDTGIVAASIHLMDLKPSSNWLFVETGSPVLLVVDVTDGSTFCSIPVAATDISVGFSQFSGRLFNIDNAGNVNIFI